MTEQNNTEIGYLERKIQHEFAATDTEFEPIDQGRSLVVVIGINKYVHQHELKNAVPDAIGLQQTLIDKLGFTAPIPPLLNEAATKPAICSLVDDRLYEVVEENDSLVIFFAGHGTTRVRKIGGKEIETGYLVPVDATQSWSEYVEIDPFLRSIGTLPAKHILVILDSCESGLALGQAMQSYRDTTRYTKDLSHRFSRKVLTSAQRDQLAQDGGGPIPNHSLFTGTLIDGFNWGKADLDRNGLITSSELGLFIQQQVGQASESKQTPDFGSFHLDDRGEMVISLRDQSFEALKVRAFFALQKGELKAFEELVKALVAVQPLSLDTLYFVYRLALLNNDIKTTQNSIANYIENNPDDSLGKAPLSEIDAQRIQRRLTNLELLLSLPDQDSPLEIAFMAGKDEESLAVIDRQKLGEVSGFYVGYNSYIKLRITNTSSIRLFVYMLKIDAYGRVEISQLWEDESLQHGLQGGATGFSYSFVQEEINGICERRIISSPQGIQSLINPPPPNAAAGTHSRFRNSFEYLKNNLNDIKMQSIRYRAPIA